MGGEKGWGREFLYFKIRVGVSGRGLLIFVLTIFFEGLGSAVILVILLRGRILWEFIWESFWCFWFFLVSCRLGSFFFLFIDTLGGRFLV